MVMPNHPQNHAAADQSVTYLHCVAKEAKNRSKNGQVHQGHTTRSHPFPMCNPPTSIELCGDFWNASRNPSPNTLKVVFWLYSTCTTNTYIFQDMKFKWKKNMTKSQPKSMYTKRSNHMRGLSSVHSHCHKCFTGGLSASYTFRTDKLILR